jgi:cobalt/nickel transport system permease protein
MGVAPFSSWLPWAVHISDGVLGNTWLAGGFVVSGLLLLPASYRVRDEEIPRIALLSAAFFVATLLHLPLGPMSVHLLFNGLVGVVLGRRAPLAILIGLGLQAALLGHGGFTTLGVNTCVLSLPALLAGWMFSVQQRFFSRNHRSNILLWVVGCVIGMTSVMATLLLNAAVVLWGGAEDWHQIVRLVFLFHLPIVGLEGIVLGFTVSFLARVKPEMLGIVREAQLQPGTAKQPDGTRDQHGITCPPAPLLVVLTLLIAACPAHAHRPSAAFTILSGHQVQIDGWFDPGGDPMKGAKVQVFRSGQSLLVEGRLDEKGIFVFRFTEPEPLEIVVSAGAGHRTTVSIRPEELRQFGNPTNNTEAPPQSRGISTAAIPINRAVSWREQFKDALIGISFLLALAAFLLSWRNARKLKSLR